MAAKRKQYKSLLMKCKQGDYARIIHSIRPENIGRVVKVVEYIGKFQRDEEFEFRGMTCKCAVTDHYWWIEGDDITIKFGPSPKAYIPDTWLEPIRPTEEKVKSSIEESLDMFMK
jgi:hypothetical protein